MFLHHCLGANPAYPGNEHPRNHSAETLSGQKKKNSLSLSLSRVFSLSLLCVMESWRVSKQNTAEAAGWLFLSQHFRALLPALFPDRSNSQPPKSCQHRVWEQEVNLVVGLHFGARICTGDDLLTKEVTVQSGSHSFEDNKCWTLLSRGWKKAQCLCVFVPPAITSNQRPLLEFAVNW